MTFLHKYLPVGIAAVAAGDGALQIWPMWIQEKWKNS
jgi:hypothetical protein